MDIMLKKLQTKMNYIFVKTLYTFLESEFCAKKHDQDIYRFSTTKLLPPYNMKLKLMIVMFRFKIL